MRSVIPQHIAPQFMILFFHYWSIECSILTYIYTYIATLPTANGTPVVIKRGSLIKLLHYDIKV